MIRFPILRSTLSDLLGARTQFTGVPTNLDKFDDQTDDNSLDLTRQLYEHVLLLHPDCHSKLAGLSPLWFFGSEASRHAAEANCLAAYEDACAHLALEAATDQRFAIDGQIDGVLFDTWDLHCWALRGLRGIHTGNRTQVGGGTDDRTAAEHSPLNRAIVTDLRFRTAQFPQHGGTNCVGGWLGTCSACYTDVTFGAA